MQGLGCRSPLRPWNERRLSENWRLKTAAGLKLMKVLWHSNPAERCVHSAACFSFGGQRNTFLYRLYYLFVNEGIFSDSYLYLFVFCSSTLKQNWCLLCTALLYLIYSWELWFLHPGALIQLVGFYVSIVHCGIMLSDLLHVKSLLKFPLFLLFFFCCESLKIHFMLKLPHVFERIDSSECDSALNVNLQYSSFFF